MVQMTREKYKDEDDMKDQEAEQKQNQFTRKIDIKQGEKDYKKSLGQLKMIKSKGGKDAIKKMNQKLCAIIIDYCNKLQKQWRKCFFPSS